jgi:hypothetical protein
MTTKMNRLWAVVALFVMVTGFTACLKSSDTQPSRPAALISVIEGINGSDALDFYDNNTKVGTSGTINVGFGASGYRTVGGTHQFSFNKSGQTTTYVSTINQYDSLTWYTVISYGDSAAPVMTTIKDDFTGASPSTLNLRFFNLSSTVGAVDLYINNIKVDSNLNYGSFASTFKPQTKVSSGSAIQVNKAGTNTVVAQMSSSSNTVVSMATGYAYTIYLTGVDGKTSGLLKPTLNYILSSYSY